jgi:hypothetical protein
MSKPKLKKDVCNESFLLLREFDETLEYMEKRIFHMRRKTAEIKAELIKNRPEYVGDD